MSDKKDDALLTVNKEAGLLHFSTYGGAMTLGLVATVDDNPPEIMLGVRSTQKTEDKGKEVFVTAEFYMSREQAKAIAARLEHFAQTGLLPDFPPPEPQNQN